MAIKKVTGSVVEVRLFFFGEIQLDSTILALFNLTIMGSGCQQGMRANG